MMHAMVEHRGFLIPGYEGQNVPDYPHQPLATLVLAAGAAAAVYLAFHFGGVARSLRLEPGECGQQCECGEQLDDDANVVSTEK